MAHQAGKDDELQAGKGFGQPFRVPDQAAKARDPGKAALNHPAPGHLDKAAFGLGQRDDFEADTVRRRLGRRLLARYPGQRRR
jgi:hypothetical protein